MLSIALIGGLTPFQSFSQTADIGLLSTLELNNLKVQSKITVMDLNWHHKIDSVSGISSFLNKVIQVNNQKYYVCIHSKSTMDELILPLKKGKTKYDAVAFYIYQNAHFACYQFKIQSKKIHRIIFSEPKLTTVILIDLIDNRDDLRDFNYKSIIQGLKLNSRIQ